MFSFDVSKFMTPVVPERPRGQPYQYKVDGEVLLSYWPTINTATIVTPCGIYQSAGDGYLVIHTNQFRLAYVPTHQQ